MIELEKQYNHKTVEDKWYEHWLSSDYFRAEIDENKKPFTISMPPPNVTGQLHMGHALTYSIQDILIRLKRMQGYAALWMPGVDHAGIATQTRVEAELKKSSGKSRHDLGREEFVKLVWDWKNKYGNIIVDQLKKLGSSCDFSRECFTMDEKLSKAVRKTFVSYYKKNIIYKGLRIINWCPRCETALSDAEVEHKEKEGKFWHIKYPIKGTNDYLQVATTRPETMLGDTAIAVHPDDERYQKYIGMSVILPLMNREIPIVADSYVDMTFGTGCVKVTPCHDPNDFDIGERHNLPKITILDKAGAVNEEGGIYCGLDRFKARKKIVEDLEEQGLLIKIEDHSHNVGHCDRCDTVIEPLASEQWFVRMKELAAPAIDAVEDGRIKFVSERFKKAYLMWMENIRDWCISRQLWWGHRIPVFYCADCGELMVEEYDVVECQKCGSKNITQDEDVLDTWFSSALWPFSTLGWPEQTPELDYFYPTSVMVTAYEILPLWVARMIFSGLELVGKEPFGDIFIHGIVRDDKGRKMSKSLNNGIDPLIVIDKYGADALRFGLINGISAGSDTRYAEEKMETARNFTNKIWNAARFILMNIDIDEADLSEVELQVEDKWILSAYNRLIGEVTANFDKYELSLAQQKIYDFIWDIFCDWYIELAKTRLNDKAHPGNKTAQNVIVYVFSGALKLLHPFMPFITEEVWRKMPKTQKDCGTESIMLASYPEPDMKYNFANEEEDLNRIISSIRAIRNKRMELDVPASKKINMTVKSKYKSVFNEKSAPFFVKLAGAKDVTFDDNCGGENMVAVITSDAVIYIPNDDIIDKEKELARLNRELDNANKEIERVRVQLSNENFVKKAPAEVIEEKRRAEEKYIALKAAVEESIQKLK